jgi:hypothetical protein
MGPVPNSQGAGRVGIITVPPGRRAGSRRACARADGDVVYEPVLQSVAAERPTATGWKARMGWSPAALGKPGSQRR